MYLERWGWSVYVRVVRVVRVSVEDEACVLLYY